jgi:hypothetical protein
MCSDDLASELETKLSTDLVIVLATVKLSYLVQSTKQLLSDSQSVHHCFGTRWTKLKTVVLNTILEFNERIDFTSFKHKLRNYFNGEPN